MRNWICALLLAAACGAPVAAGEAGRPHVIDGTVDGPAEEVWRLFTTKAGVESWMVPKAEIDWRVGGTMKTSYDSEKPIDHPETIVHEIMAYDPHRMIAMRVSKCPEGFPFAEEIESTWTVIYFEPLDGGNRTRVRIVGLGYGESARADSMRAFFESGNTWTLEQLRKRVGGTAKSDRFDASGMPTPGKK